MCKNPKSDLPSGYTKLNYLESTGTQYIDLGVTPLEIIKMQLIFDYKITDYANNSVLFGATDYFYIHQLFVYTSHEKVGLQWCYGTPDWTLIVDKDTKRHNIKIDLLTKNALVDGESYEITINNNQAIKLNIYLFCRNTKNTATSFISARIYSFKIQNGDELYRNFVPALDTKNRPCLYDTVSHKPFYNQGKGEFLYG